MVLITGCMCLGDSWHAGKKRNSNAVELAMFDQVCLNHWLHLSVSRQHWNRWMPLDHCDSCLLAGSERKMAITALCGHWKRDARVHLSTVFGSCGSRIHGIPRLICGSLSLSLFLASSHRSSEEQ